ncbi:hypothetical protein CVT24_004292 [Panaeolus cyanescens]|uniref:Prenylcysteine lyase domain-containing protein n=1 Tax=Panaeolus cyanescens TaxID=181874 RepID=A0A409VA55_9AGAR|nr:hypothetical protein CVT24_004292 [Panaeolus cyanescens]
MAFIHIFLLLSATLPNALAFDFHFRFPSIFSKSVVQSHSDPQVPSTTPRIAIVGAGAGGSSAAFWVSKAKDRFGLNVEIDIYERSSYIGGRSTVVYPYNDTSLPEFELGASIFVEANKNLWRASDEFNLTRRDFQDQNYQTGIWDGEQVLVAFSGGWWDTAKLLWRYGFLSPQRTSTVVQNMIKRFLHLYQPDAPKWDNIADLADAFEWTQLINSTTAEFLLSQGVSEKYIHEVVEAATRVNYGQNVDSIHALEGACSMAATGATGIAGGNFQIFEAFVNRSGANVFLDTTVKSITPKNGPSHLWTLKSDRGSVDYQAVVFAAPFHSTGIVVPNTISEQIPPQPYVNLHVTLLSTTSPTANPAYFGLPSDAIVPRMLLTTYQGAREGHSKPEFNSMSYHGEVREGEWAVKIFSDHELSDEWLSDMFLGQVGWVHRKVWNAYPKLPPTTSFPPVKLDKGLYYVNAFEPFISTMETETIAARNAVDLLLNDEFDSSICGRHISPPVEVQSDGSQQPFVAPQPSSSTLEDFVLGWDC